MKTFDQFLNSQKCKYHNFLFCLGKIFEKIKYHNFIKLINFFLILSEITQLHKYFNLIIFEKNFDFAT